MTFTYDDAVAADALLGQLSAGLEGDAGTAIACVALCARRVAREVAVRNTLIRVAHESGASLRQIADASGLDRKTVTAIVQRP